MVHKSTSSLSSLIEYVESVCVCVLAIFVNQSCWQRALMELAFARNWDNKSDSEVASISNSPWWENEMCGGYTNALIYIYTYIYYINALGFCKFLSFLLSKLFIWLKAKHYLYPTKIYDYYLY